MTIQDIISHFNTVPFLFVGSGLSRRTGDGSMSWKDSFGICVEFSEIFKF